MITPKNILSHELIGLRVTILTSPQPRIVGVSGTIIFETKNMLTLRTNSGPKKISKLSAEKIRLLLPSGVCFLDVWFGRRNFELEYHPTQGTGVSENFDDTPPFIGHDVAFDSLDEAAEHFKSLLADAARTEVNHLPQAMALREENSIWKKSQ